MVLRKGWLRHLDFILIDLVCIEISLLLAKCIGPLLFPAVIGTLKPLYMLIPVLNIFTSIMQDGYNGILQRGYLKEFFALLKQELVIFSELLLVIYFLRIVTIPPRSTIVLYFFINFLLTYVCRFLQKFNLRRIYADVRFSRQIVVATTESVARSMIGTITQSAIRNYQFFGLIILDKSMIGETIEGVPVAADKDTFINYVKDQIVDEVFINLPDDSVTTLHYVRQLLDMGITAHIYMENAYQELPNRHISNVFGYNVLSSTISPVTFRQSLVKRAMDIIGGIVGCLLTLVIALIIGPIIYVQSPGPIFFSQTRVGKKGRQFKIYKFRSMYMDAEERKKELMAQNKIKDGMMFKMDDDPRIIKGIGHFIRKTSLDEFPQFFNVLKGDMSLVGTRPPTIDEYQRYSPHHKRRLSMLPGITGLWQTSGRSSIIDFEDVVRLDTEYIENWSFDLDVKILFRTVMKLVYNHDAM